MFHLPPDIQLKNLVLSSARHLDTFLNLVLGLIFNLLRTHEFTVDADTFETGFDVASLRSALQFCSRFFLPSLSAHFVCFQIERKGEEKEKIAVRASTTHFSCPLPLA